MGRLLECAVLAGFALGCVPSHLAKYQKKDDSSPTPSSRDVRPSFGDGGPTGPNAPELRIAQTKTERATVFAVDRQTYRFALREDDVWDTALQVLLKNYNLTIVDRNSGVVTTEWDTFYIKNNVYRNKVSLRVRRLNREYIEVQVRNNVERLRDGSAAGTVGAVWLPAEDPGNEVVRIVQNMAMAMNQPPPVIPPDQVANGVAPAAPQQPARR